MAASPYVSQSEYDTFQGKVMTEISSIKTALTQDARSRAKRDELITFKLEELSRKIGNSNAGQDDREDITGRFNIAEAKLLQKMQVEAQTVQKKALPREFSINVTGTALAIAAWKLIELILSAKGH